MPRKGKRSAGQVGSQSGFSLLELLVSVSIITLLMAIVFQFLEINQKRHRSQQLMAEVTQGGRGAFEVMAQELNQAGYNPPFTVSKRVGGSGTVTPGTGLISIPIAAGTSPATKNIFYGTRLVIGNNCTGSPSVCNQEEVVVNYDTTYGTTALGAASAPMVIANPHAAGEPIFTRNFPYPSGILYNNYAGGVGLGIADNKLRFYGDIMDTGDLYYGEYRLQCRGNTPGTYINACTTGCTTGPFVLTRFMTRLANASSGIFQIPASKAAALDGATVSPLVDNIQGTCATGGGTAPANWTVFTAPDETSPTGSTAVNAALSWSAGVASYITPVLNPDRTPAIWFKLNTYGAWDNSTSPPTPYFQSFVLDVRVTLTVQQSQRDPETGTVRLQRLQTHIVPKNINNALSVAQNGGAVYLPRTPIDPTTNNTLPLP